MDYFKQDLELPQLVNKEGFEIKVANKIDENKNGILFTLHTKVNDKRYTCSPIFTDREHYNICLESALDLFIIELKNNK